MQAEEYLSQHAFFCSSYVGIIYVTASQEPQHRLLHKILESYSTKVVLVENRRSKSQCIVDAFFSAIAQSLLLFVLLDQQNFSGQTVYCPRVFYRLLFRRPYYSFFSTNTIFSARACFTYAFFLGYCSSLIDIPIHVRFLRTSGFHGIVHRTSLYSTVCKPLITIHLYVSQTPPLDLGRDF